MLEFPGIKLNGGDISKAFPAGQIKRSSIKPTNQPYMVQKQLPQVSSQEPIIICKSETDEEKMERNQIQESENEQQDQNDDSAKCSSRKVITNALKTLDSESNQYSEYSSELDRSKMLYCTPLIKAQNPSALLNQEFWAEFDAGVEQWGKQAILDSQKIENEYVKASKKKSDQNQAFKVESTAAYRLHKFKGEIPVNFDPNDPQKFTNQDVKNLIVNDYNHPTNRLNDGPAKDVHFNCYVPGIVKNLKSRLFYKNKLNINSDKIKQELEQSSTRRQDYKRTIIGVYRHEQFGFKLERRQDFKFPEPIMANNFKQGVNIQKIKYKSKYKGSLYNEAGRICLELTEKYPQIDSFKFQTMLEHTVVQYQLGYVYYQKQGQRKRIEDRNKTNKPKPVIPKKQEWNSRTPMPNKKFGETQMMQKSEVMENSNLIFHANQNIDNKATPKKVTTTMNGLLNKTNQASASKTGIKNLMNVYQNKIQLQTNHKLLQTQQIGLESSSSEVPNSITEKAFEEDYLVKPSIQKKNQHDMLNKTQKTLRNKNQPKQVNQNKHNQSIQEEESVSDLANFHTHLEKLKKKWNKSKENKLQVTENEAKNNEKTSGFSQITIQYLSLGDTPKTPSKFNDETPVMNNKHMLKKQPVMQNQERMHQSMVETKDTSLQISNQFNNKKLSAHSHLSQYLPELNATQNNNNSELQNHFPSIRQSILTEKEKDLLQNMNFKKKQAGQTLQIQPSYKIDSLVKAQPYDYKSIGQNETKNNNRKTQKIKTFYDICKQEEALQELNLSLEYDANNQSFQNQLKQFNPYPKLPYLQGYDLTVGLNSNSKTKNQTNKDKYMESKKQNTFQTPNASIHDQDLCKGIIEKQNLTFSEIRQNESENEGTSNQQKQKQKYFVDKDYEESSIIPKNVVKEKPIMFQSNLLTSERFNSIHKISVQNIEQIGKYQNSSLQTAYKTRNFESNFKTDNNSKLFGKTRLGNSKMSDASRQIPNHKHRSINYGSDIDEQDIIELKDLSKKQAGTSRSIVAFNATNQFHKEKAKQSDHQKTPMFCNNDEILQQQHPLETKFISKAGKNSKLKDYQQVAAEGGDFVDRQTKNKNGNPFLMQRNSNGIEGSIKNGMNSTQQMAYISGKYIVKGSIGQNKRNSKLQHNTMEQNKSGLGQINSEIKLDNLNAKLKDHESLRKLLVQFNNKN